MDNKVLQQWVEKVSLESFGRPFLHKATFNARLKATGGRYFTRTHHIEISPHQLDSYGPEETEKIIKHELCHYHLHIMKRGYQHRDADFKTLLAHVGGSRYCKSLPERIGKKATAFRYKLVCRHCGMEYLRKRKVDPSKYVCGKCRGKLLLFMLDNSSGS
ncbi:SprT family protein [Paenibacillus sp. GSMTC-2017]|uniref:SprT family protein n=1 Tax=Paenibacillus sp. GSMTC-2017 TaxID=2794350 RepID=UPI0018D7643C|nr:SprT family protein [Paenibacillus sp. GSMTC-2017]MBH5319166.1 SprT family protein [Paenibacillus sp. GSMTC-2017]